MLFYLSDIYRENVRMLVSENSRNTKNHTLSVKRADLRTGGAFSSRSSVNQVFLRTGAGNANVQGLLGRDRPCALVWQKVAVHLQKLLTHNGSFR